MNPEKFRAHDYTISAEGHLQLRPPRGPDPLCEQTLALRRSRAQQQRRAEEKLAAPKPEPKPAPAPPPPKPVASVPAPSRHDELVAAVAGLVRQGVGYTEAMDRVLEAPDYAEKSERAHAQNFTKNQAVTQRIMTPAEMLDCVTMLRAWNEHHRAIPHTDGACRAFKPLSPSTAHWLITERISNGDGSFEKSAWNLIRQKDDLTEQLDYRESLILAGKVPS